MLVLTNYNGYFLSLFEKGLYFCMTKCRCFRLAGILPEISIYIIKYKDM